MDKKELLMFATLLILLILLTDCQKELNDDVASKIQPQLLTFFNLSDDQIPKYLINNDNTWNVIVVCNKTIAPEKCKGILQKYGVVNQEIGISAFGLKIKKEIIMKLVKEKSIQYIEGDFSIAIVPEPKAAIVAVNNTAQNEKYCKKDSNCEPVFINCNCKYECLKNVDEPRDDCTRDCTNKKTQPIPVCTCTNDQCQINESSCENKISANLKEGIPSWAINNDGSIKVTIACDNETNCAQIISQYGTITEQWSNRIYEANLFNTSIYALACESNIKFIERAKGTPEPTTN